MDAGVVDWLIGLFRSKDFVHIVLGILGQVTPMLGGVVFLTDSGILQKDCRNKCHLFQIQLHWKQRV